LELLALLLGPGYGDEIRASAPALDDLITYAIIREPEVALRFRKWRVIDFCINNATLKAKKKGDPKR
jgi:hypothetical protein